MELDADKKIKDKHEDKELKHEYQSNLNILFILIKLEMLDLLSKNPKEREEAADRIVKIAQSNLVLKNDENDKNPNRITKDPKNKYPSGQRRAE